MGRFPTQTSIDALVAYNKSGRSLEHRRKLSEARMGVSPSNKGVPMSQEQKDLLSEIKTGIPLLKKRVPVLQCCKEGNFIKEWDSATTAAKELSISRANIVACLNGRRNFCGGYKWKYKTEDIVQP